MSEKHNEKNKNMISLPLVGDYSSRKEWELACWDKIVASGILSEALITPYEMHNLVVRAAAMNRISSGKNYRQISEELFLSAQTINAIKRTMDGGNYKSYRERSKTERKKKIYSSSRAAKKHHGRPVRTKYGILYLPN